MIQFLQMQRQREYHANTWERDGDCAGAGCLPQRVGGRRISGRTRRRIPPLCRASNPQRGGKISAVNCINREAKHVCLQSPATSPRRSSPTTQITPCPSLPRRSLWSFFVWREQPETRNPNSKTRNPQLNAPNPKPPAASPPSISLLLLAQQPADRLPCCRLPPTLVLLLTTALAENTW